MKMVMILIITLRLFNIAMETGPSIHVFCDLPIKNGKNILK